MTMNYALTEEEVAEGEEAAKPATASAEEK